MLRWECEEIAEFSRVLVLLRGVSHLSSKHHVHVRRETGDPYHSSLYDGPKTSGNRDHDTRPPGPIN